MGRISAIEWTDATWNPVRGCSKVSPGCKNCYAEAIAERFRGVSGHAYEAGFELRLVPEKLAEPLRWRAPLRIFVNSMSDLFHEKVPESYIASVGRTIERAHWHTFQILTKRHQRMRQLLNGNLRWMGALPNAWFGVSVENRRYGLPRIGALRSTAATNRFLSVEPLLEHLGTIDLSGIDWVIVGGESGRNARPIRQAWVLSILRQCRQAGIPFFFKQWGGPDKTHAGRTLRGRTYDAFPNDGISSRIEEVLVQCQSVRPERRTLTPSTGPNTRTSSVLSMNSFVPT
jgi:protein gp37